ncbi:Ankyrin_repeat-containing domain superfamily [Hexamita inflata]|uniref:Ankyrin repeat-containing domain superfamily n=1 Tax=Hexamita inflata TaxID=28002 RepID=A0AA86R4K6_9EUKA|nr:Ankyrin repeat-containing domain superfamily [Hexamita inflata]
MVYLIKLLIQKQISDDNDLLQKLVKKHFELGNDFEQQQLIRLLTQNKYEKYLEFLKDNSLIKINKLGIQDQVTVLQQQIIDNTTYSIASYKDKINSRSLNGWTCLMFASIFNQSQIKTFQFQIGQKNQNNQTALMLIIIFEVFNKLDDKQMQEFVELEARSVDDHKKSCLQHILDKEFLIDAVQAKAWFKCLFNLEYDLIQKSDKINQTIKRLPYSMQELISPEMFRKTEIASAEKTVRKVSTLTSKQEVQTKKQGKIDLIKIVNSNNCKSYIETLQADQESSEFIKLLEQYKPWLVEYLPKESVICYFEQYLTEDIPTNLMSTSQELAVLYIKYSKIQLDESILKKAAAHNKAKIIECFDDKQLLAFMVTNMPESEAEIVKFIVNQPIRLQRQYLSSLQTVIIGENVNVINALFNKQCFQQLSYIPEYMINSFLNKTFEFYKTDDYCPKKYVIKNLLLLAPKQVAQILNKYSLERFHHEYLIELAVQAKAWDAVKLVDQKILKNINPSVKTLNTMISCCKNEESMINFIHCFGFTIVRKTVNLQQYHTTIYKTAKTLNKQIKFLEEMKKIVHLYGWNLLHMYTREGYTDHFQRNNFNYKVIDVFGTNLDHRIKLADYADEEWEE